MTELEQELQNIFDKLKQEYRTTFNKGEGLQVKADNAGNFNRINEDFIDEMIKATNAYIKENPSVTHDEAKGNIKTMIQRFSRVMLNPFE